MPLRATQGSTNIREEAGGMRGEHEHEPLLWFRGKGKAGLGSSLRIG